MINEESKCLTALERYELSIKLINERKINNFRDHWCMRPSRDSSHDACACLGCIDHTFIKNGLNYYDYVFAKRTKPYKKEPYEQ